MYIFIYAHRTINSIKRLRRIKYLLNINEPNTITVMCFVSYFFIFKIVPRYPCKLLVNAIQTDCSIYEGTWCRSTKSGAQSVGAQSVGAQKVGAQSMGAQSIGAQSMGAQNIGAQSVEAQSMGRKVWGRKVWGRKVWGAKCGAQSAGRKILGRKV